jgi:hypothetical protein
MRRIATLSAPQHRFAPKPRRCNDAPIRQDAQVGLVLVVLVVIAAVLVAVVAIAVRNQRAGVTRRTHDPTIDPFGVGEPWRRLVQGALRSQSRYRELVRTTAPGPMHDALADIGAEVDAAVSECWRIARRGDDLGQALDDMAVARARQQLAALGTDDTDPAVVGQAEALRSRIASYDRVSASSADAERQLRLLVARLEETATRGTELSLTAGADPDLAALGTDVTHVVEELEALRVAFDELPRGEIGA